MEDYSAGQRADDSVLFLMYNKDNPADALIFPVTPTSAKQNIEMLTRSIETAGQGTVILPGKRNPYQAQFDGFFPGAAIQDYAAVVSWTAPDDCVVQVTRWVDQATVLQFLVTGTPINFQGYITACPISVKDANGSYGYNLTFVEARDIEILFVANEQATGTTSTSIPAAGSSGTTTAAINVRSGPGYTYEVIDRLDASTKVKITDANDTWRKVSYGSPARVGWVEGAYLQTASSSGSSSGAGSPHYKLPRTYTTTGREKGIAAIARKFYGSSAYKYVNLIASYNKENWVKLHPGAGNRLPKGIKVYIPPKASTPMPHGATD